MTRNEFQQLWVEVATEVADKFYPKNEHVWSEKEQRTVQTERSKRRGEFLLDQGVLHAKLSERLKEEGVLT